MSTTTTEGVRQDFDIRHCVQSVEDHARLCLRPDQKIEARKDPAENCAGGARGIKDRTTIGRKTYVLAVQEELDTVPEIVVQRDLGNGSVDRYLQLRSVKLLRAFAR